MAKGKHAAALFEVIQGSKGVGVAGSESLRTPKWWFKGRPQETVAAPAPEPLRAAAQAPSSAVATLAAPVAPRIAAVEALAPEVQIPRVEPRLRNDPTRTRLERTTSGAVEHAGGALRNFQFRLRYPTALLAGFILMMAVCMAYVLGRRAASGPENAAAAAVDPEVVPTAPTREIRKHPAKPDTLDVPRRARVSSQNLSGETGWARGSEAVRHEPPTAPMSNNVHGLSPIPPAATGAAPVPRVIGLNYIIAQSYPEKKMASEACDFLNRSGIACTVVPGPSDFTHETWYSVVTTRGFERIHTPECEAAVAAILNANKAFTAGKYKFKRLEPTLYRWK